MYYSKKADDKTLGIILMEDVGEKGKSLEVHQSSTLEQCEDAIKLIANFQVRKKKIIEKCHVFRH